MVGGSKPMKSVLKRERKTLFVIETGRTYRETIVERNTAIYAETLPEGSPIPDVGIALDSDLMVLETSLADYLTAVRQRGEAEAVLRETHKAAKEMTKSGANELRAFSRRMIARHGAEGLRAVGLDSNPADHIDALLQQLIFAHTVVMDRTLDWPAHLPGRRALDREEAGKLIDEQIRDIRPVATKLKHVTKKREEAFLRKKQLEEVLDTRYRGVARQIEGRLRMAGLDEVAVRLRLTPRRKPKKEPEPAVDAPTSDSQVLEVQVCGEQ